MKCVCFQRFTVLYKRLLVYGFECLYFCIIPVASKRKDVTVAIIKPDAVAKGLVDDILEKVKSRGLEVLAHEERVLTREEAAEFYSHHSESVCHLLWKH